MQEFWIYENWKNNGHRSRIHLSSCKYCTHEAPAKKGSAWHGPFQKLDEAIKVGGENGAKTVICALCLKKLNVTILNTNSF